MKEGKFINSGIEKIKGEKGIRKKSVSPMVVAIIFTAIVLFAFFTAAIANAATDLLVAQAGTPSGISEVNAPAIDQGAEAADELVPITLDECIALALDNNRTLQQAKQAIEIARAGGRSALASFLPDLNLLYTYTHAAAEQKIVVPGVGEFVQKGIDTWYTQLTFQYQLYSGGESSAKKRSADAEVEATSLQEEEAVNYVRLQTSTSYTYVLESLAMVESANTSLQHLDEVLRVTQASYDAGLVPLNDLLSVQVAKASGEQNLKEMEKTLSLARSSLALTLGQDIDMRWELALVEYPILAVPYDSETLRSWAMENRASLKQLAAKRKSLAAQLDAVNSMSLPRVSFQATINGVDKDPFPKKASSIEGMITVYWDIFNFGKTADYRGPIEEQLALLDIQEQDLKNQVELEVESALLNVNTRLGNIEVGKAAMASAEEAFRVAQRRQAEGLGMTIQVLDAESKLSQSSAGYYHYLYDYYRGLDALSVSVGMNTADFIALMVASKAEEN